MGISDITNKIIGDKRAWRAYRARTKALPEPYQKVERGIERYLMYAGGAGEESQMQRMFDDLVELFERAAADGTPVRDIVGDDPVDFVETFKSNYGYQNWLGKQQRRLVDTIAEAERESEQ